MPLVDNNRCRLLVVDMQEKLLPAMYQPEGLIRNSGIVLQAAITLGISALVSEQYPAGLGPTIDQIRCLAPDIPRWAKTTFSCMGDTNMRDWLDPKSADQIVLVGVEAHVCVLQTAMDLQAAGAEVFVVADAVSSRKASSVEAALSRLAASRPASEPPISIVTAEMVVFEWMRTAASPHFKVLSKLIR
ncbi:MULTISPECIES: isochorismatase family protein [unclassified Chelatococcus]|uniref:isochorismatase family protein n=1 Tax=unclassified Chelatococcus TaxID=2638111 RepID=UPI001BCEB0C7|nr:MULTISPECIES: isochorismatase family protein [unclassified Chelatococcus]MBS7700831.1 isochorismatase family protein [Chelatococcus sp. YT9]MBX3555364.1 isochorismatase family protein [Chelatococcus sp.]